MNVSVKADYSLLAILDLALQPPGEPVRIADIARRQKIPQKFLEQLLATLKQGGFVESRRGAEGGYLLARPAETITVGEVMRYVEGPAVRGDSRRAADYPLSDLWRQVDDAIAAVVDRTSFGELARAWQEKQSQYIPNWEI